MKYIEPDFWCFVDFEDECEDKKVVAFSFSTTGFIKPERFLSDDVMNVMEVGDAFIVETSDITFFLHKKRNIISAYLLLCLIDYSYERKFKSNKFRMFVK